MALIVHVDDLWKSQLSIPSFMVFFWLGKWEWEAEFFNGFLLSKAGSVVVERVLPFNCWKKTFIGRGSSVIRMLMIQLYISLLGQVVVCRYFDNSWEMNQIQLKPDKTK